MKTFTDEEMGQLLPTAKTYSVVILQRGPRFTDDGALPIIWEHGRRNFGLRDDGQFAGTRGDAGIFSSGGGKPLFGPGGGWVISRDPALETPRGEAARHLLYLFERDEAIRLLMAG